MPIKQLAHTSPQQPLSPSHPPRLGPVSTNSTLSPRPSALMLGSHGSYTKRCPAKVTTQHPYFPFHYTRQCPKSLANCPHRCRESACTQARIEGQGGERAKPHIQHHLPTVTRSRRVKWCLMRSKSDGRQQREGDDERGEVQRGAGGTRKRGSSSIAPGQLATSSAEKDGGSDEPMIHGGGGSCQARVELFGHGDHECTWIRCRLEEHIVMSELPSR